jgi:hypothetical protein
LCRDLAFLAGLASIVCSAFSPQAASASEGQAKAAPEYRILGPDEVLLEASSKAIDCINSYGQRNQNGGACIAEVKLNGVAATSPPIQVCGQGWFLLTFPQGSMAPDQQYLLTYRDVAALGGEPVAARNPKGVEPLARHKAKEEPSAIILDTYQKISVSLIAEPGRYAFTSVTAFGKESDYDDYRNPPSCRHDPQAVGQLPFTLHADQPATDQKVIDEVFVGLISSPRWGGQDVLGVKFVSDNAPSEASGSEVAQGILSPYKKSRKAPSGKSDAELYANVSLAAASGASFAWGLDGKISACPDFKASWQLVACPDIFGTSKYGAFGVRWLSATANGGHNTGNIQGQSYTDSVDWNLPITYVPQRGNVLITGAPDFETDWELDRRNFLGTLGLFWQPENNTQQNKIDRGGPAIADPVAYVGTRDGRQGYEFDAQFGFEGGQAIDDTTQKPTKGNAPAVLIPAYSISRAVPQLHGVYQYWRFGFDETFVGRYLFLTENSATQSKANIVYPERLNGWKGINKLNWSYKTNPTGAFSLSLTYTDGFDAPKFRRTNSITAGLTFMY